MAAAGAGAKPGQSVFHLQMKKRSIETELDQANNTFNRATRMLKEETDKDEDKRDKVKIKKLIRIVRQAFANVNNLRERLKNVRYAILLKQRQKGAGNRAATRRRREQREEEEMARMLEREEERRAIEMFNRMSPAERQEILELAYKEIEKDLKENGDDSIRRTDTFRAAATTAVDEFEGLNFEEHANMMDDELAEIERGLADTAGRMAELDEEVDDIVKERRRLAGYGKSKKRRRRKSRRRRSSTRRRRK